MIHVANTALLALGETSYDSTPVWSPDSQRLTYVSVDWWSIMQVDIQTHAVSTVLTQHEAGIFGISWTPDGEHLVFVLGISGDLNAVPPFQLYTYSPSHQQG